MPRKPSSLSSPVSMCSSYLPPVFSFAISAAWSRPLSTRSSCSLASFLAWSKKSGIVGPSPSSSPNAVSLYRTPASLGKVMASLAVTGMFALAMIIAAARAAVALPAEARIPLHLGSVERCYLVPKRAGLVIWPAAGLAVAGVLGGIAASSLAAGWVPGVRYVLTPAATGVLLAFEVGALVARERETTARSE